MTTITVVDVVPSYWKGVTVTIDGGRYIITDATGSTLTIRHASAIERIKSTLSYWKWKAIELYWDIADEFIENWDAFNEWRKA